MFSFITDLDVFTMNVDRVVGYDTAGSDWCYLEKFGLGTVKLDIELLAEAEAELQYVVELVDVVG